MCLHRFAEFIKNLRVFQCHFGRKLKDDSNFALIGSTLREKSRTGGITGHAIVGGSCSYDSAWCINRLPNCTQNHSSQQQQTLETLKNSKLVKLKNGPHGKLKTFLKLQVVMEIKIMGVCCSLFSPQWPWLQLT